MRYSLILLILFCSITCYAQQETDSLVVVGNISLEGNKKTRNAIITRELYFSTGDTLTRQKFEDQVELTRQQLINLNLFNFVGIDHRKNDTTGRVDVYIRMVERWYVWVVPEFTLADRNFNQWWLTKDFSRTNYGFKLYLFNLAGRNQTLKLTFIHGYTQLYEARYSVPYINRKKTLGLVLESRFSRNHEIWMDTRGSKLQFLKDEDDFTIRRFRTAAALIVRRNMRVISRFDIGYNLYAITDTVIRPENNPYYLAEGKEQRELTFSYLFQVDHRNSINYPTHGTLTRFELSQYLVNRVNGPHFVYLALSRNLYYRLKYPRWFTAFSAKVKGIIGAPQPYLNLTSLGYRDYVRGYEYYVMDGQAAVLLKGGIKYALIPDGEYYISFIPFKNYRHVNRSLYLTLFSDLGYVNSTYKNAINPYNNTLLAGAGLGLDAVVYYDRMLRLELSMNRNKKVGLYLHFLIGI